jgi:hypothetical protein
VPLGLACDGANRNDHKLLKATLEALPIARPEPTVRAPQGLCLDAAYDNRETRELLGTWRLTPHIRSGGEEISLSSSTCPAGAPGAGSLKPATPSLNRNRALLIRWSKKPENHRAPLQLACGLIAFKKAHAARLSAALQG